MNVDTELELWRRQWQADAQPMPPFDLQAKVERQTRFMRWMLLSEVAVTAIMGGGTTALAYRSPNTGMIVLAIAVWLFLAVAWAFGLSNRRGTWNPEGSTTADFLDLSLRRCRRRMSAGWFGAILYIGEMVFCLTWIFEYGLLSASLVLAVGGATIALGGLLLWYQRNRRRELDYLLDLRQQLGEEPAVGRFARQRRKKRKEAW